MRDYLRRAVALDAVGVWVGIGLCLLAVIGLARLQIDSSIRSMLVEGDPAYLNHERLKGQFGSDEILSVAIPFEDPLSDRALRTQHDIVQRLEGLDGVVRVDALVTQDDVVGDADGLDVEPLFRFANSRVIRRYPDAEGRSRIAQHPIWNGWLISEDQGVVALQVELDDSQSGQLGRDQTMRVIEQVLADSLVDGGYYLAGHPFMKRETAASVARDLGRLMPLSIAAMALALFVYFRSIPLCGAVILSVLGSVGAMLGAMGVAGLGLTALTNACPAILIALCTANYLHLVVAFSSSPAHTSALRAAEARRRVFRPMLLSGITTAAGYTSLSISSVPLIREFGIALSVGVLFSLLVGLTVLPALLSRLPEASAAGGRFGRVVDRALARIAGGLVRAPALVVALSVVALGFFALAAARIEIDSSGPRRFSDDSTYSRSSAFYRDRMSGDVVETVYLECEDRCFLRPETLSSLQLVAEAAEALPAVDKVITPAAYLERIYWVFRGEEGDPAELPPSEDAAAQLLLLYDSSASERSLDQYLSSDRGAARILLKAAVQSSSESAALRADLEQIVANFLPELASRSSVVSTEMLLSQAAETVTLEQARSLGVALALILGLVAIGLASIRAPLQLLLPNLLPLAVIFGGMALVGESLSDSASVVAAATIGVAVDGTVHLLFSARQASRRGAPAPVSALHAISTAGRAVVVSGVIVMIGFLVLCGSEFRSVGELGALTSLTMMCCLIADLVVLPAQLMLGGVGLSGGRFALVLDGDLFLAGEFVEESTASTPARVAGVDGAVRDVSPEALVVQV